MTVLGLPTSPVSCSLPVSVDIHSYLAYFMTVLQLEDRTQEEVFYKLTEGSMHLVKRRQAMKPVPNLFVHHPFNLISPTQLQELGLDSPKLNLSTREVQSFLSEDKKQKRAEV